MEIGIHAVGFSMAGNLRDFVEAKVSKLVRFDDDIESADVYLKLGNDQEERKVAEVKLQLRGDVLFAEKPGASFEEATDEAVEAVRRQLMKRKGKQRD
ncbi:MAG: ribosomal subunit interface protein [Bacteroidetes bacterium]|nr:MAG: ribosomal subunit interface protein [Bacteroidota bacterium]